MKIPFSIAEFLSVFERYNSSVWPAQAFLFLLAVASVVVVIRKENSSTRIAFSILAFLWIWMGAVYHIIFFSPINPTAKIFGSLFIVQALIFLYAGVIKSNLELKFEKGWISTVGLIMIAYSLIIYPILGYL